MNSPTSPITAIDLHDRLTGQDHIDGIIVTGGTWPHDGKSLQQCHLSGCQFHGVNFNGINLGELYVEDTLFDDCNFTSANLNHSEFLSCQFYLRESELGCRFNFAKLIETRMERCDLSLCNLSRSECFNFQAVDCQLQGINLKAASFSQVIGKTVTLTAALFRSCNLAYADLSHVNLTDCDLSASRLSHACLDNSDLSGTDLSETDLSSVSASGLCLKGADLRNAQISGLDVRDIDVTGVKILAWQQQILLEQLGMEICQD